MEYLFIYCLQLFEDVGVIKDGCLFFGIFLGVVGIVVYFAIESGRYKYDDDETKLADKMQKLCKVLPTTLLSIGIFACFIPTKQTLLLMGGMYLGKKAVNSVVTDEKIKKIDTIINLELDKRVKKLQKEVR